MWKTYKVWLLIGLVYIGFYFFMAIKAFLNIVYSQHQFFFKTPNNKIMQKKL